jgi:ABC-type transporter Mla maintaining outer membrane lipid asymmetry ATPase subunit MlaF
MERSDANGPVLETMAVDVLSAWNHHIQLTGVNWKVLPGEYWVIGGPHGSGKTDLLMTVAGLRQPAAGSIRVFGREMAQLSQAELLDQRKRIGFVFKGGGRMFTELTVAENVALALCYHHNWSTEQAREEVSAVLEITELTALAQETAQTIGSDWQQRVGLARALALKPEVMFFDEPAAGLAERHRQWWRNFLAQLSSGIPYTGGRKVTVIAATNDFTLWHGGNHRYALIKDKRWHESGERAEYPQIE